MVSKEMRKLKIMRKRHGKVEGERDAGSKSIEYSMEFQE